jgi:tetratricopeptide (TPR) repeat protein
MRPDSRLYIVPFEGGEARPLAANTPRMNSWHSFSPNGRWLVFSSKGRSLYTQLYLTHIDADGNDSPAIRIENATAANRAVNIPEFANIGPDGLTRIETPAIEFYRLFDTAVVLTEKGDYPAAIPAWQKAMELDPEDSKARYNLGLALDHQGKLAEAIAEYRKSVEINAQNAPAFTNLGIALSRTGKLDEAVAALTQSVTIRPANAMAQSNLAAALLEKGETDHAVEHIQKALETDPEFADANNMLGIVLARAGKLDDGIAHLEKAVANTPDSPEYRFNLGRLLAAHGRFADAIPHFEQAVKLSGGEEPQSLEMLAAMYAEVGRFAQAAEVAHRALDVAVRANNLEMAQRLRPRVAAYEAAAKR